MTKFKKENNWAKNKLKESQMNMPKKEKPGNKKENNN
jgi:hypothetical protein